MIGPVNRAAQSACSRAERSIAPGSSANEIFFHLDGRTVHYDAGAGQLYFVEAPDSAVRSIIRAVLAGMRSAARIHQMHLDPHRLFGGAHRAQLAPAQARAVLTALRLAGIRAV